MGQFLYYLARLSGALRVVKMVAGSALFWGEGDAIDPDNPDMAALLALQDEVPAAERAEAYKARLRPTGSGARR